jgi:hypothetical protein
MEEIEAQIIVTAYAACTHATSCDLCPLYNAELTTAQQQRLCERKITPEEVKKALETLRGLKAI